MFRVILFAATLCVTTTTHAADPDYVAEYVKRAKAEAKQQEDAIRVKGINANRAIAIAKAKGRNDLENKTKLKELKAELVRLKKEPPIWDMPKKYKAGDMGVFTIEFKVVSVADEAIVLTPIIPIEQVRQVQGVQLNGLPGSTHLVAEQIGERDGAPLTIKGYKGAELQAGQRVKLRADMPFHMTADNEAALVDMAAVKTKYVKAK